MVDVLVARRVAVVGEAVQRVLDRFLEQRQAQDALADRPLGGQILGEDLFRLQVGVADPGRRAGGFGLEQFGHGREAVGLAERGAQRPVGSRLPGQAELGRSAAFFAIVEAVVAQGRGVDPAIGGLPGFLAHAGGQRPVLGEFPFVLQVEGLRLRPPLVAVAQRRPARLVQPVAGVVLAVVVAVGIVVETGRHCVAAAARLPDQAEIGVVPAGTVVIGQRAGTGTGRVRRPRQVGRRLIHREGAFEAPVVGQPAVESQAVQAVDRIAARRRKIAGGQVVALAVDQHGATAHRLAGGILQVALLAAGRIVAPLAEGEGESGTRREVVGQADLADVLDGVVHAVGADDDAASAGRVAVDHGAADRGATRTAGRPLGGGKAHRLAIAVEVVGHRRNAQLAVAHGAAALLLMAVRRHVGVVELEIGREHLGPDMRLGPFRLPRRHQDRRPRRITRQQRGKRPIQHVDRIDLLAADQVPARRVGVAVAKQVGEQQAVGVDQRAGALHGAGGARRDDRIAVADVALADLQAGHVFDDVLGIDDVHVARLFAGHFRLRRRVLDDGARPALAHRHFGELLGILIVGRQQLTGSNQGGNRQRERLGARVFHRVISTIRIRNWVGSGRRS